MFELILRENNWYCLILRKCKKMELNVNMFPGVVDTFKIAIVLLLKGMII